MRALRRVTTPVSAVLRAARRRETYGGHVREATSALITAGIWPSGFRDPGAADFVGTRRDEGIDWFALVGVVANDAGDPKTDADGSKHPHERFEIGDGTSLTLKKGGYLYAYANDAWHMYDNNRGSVQLQVKRTA